MAAISEVESCSFLKRNLDERSQKALTPASFFNLPRELCLHILSFLTQEELCDSVAPVCQVWSNLAEDPSLWKSLRIYVRRDSETPKFALKLLRCPMLTKLKIYTCFPLEEFALLCYAIPNLKHLDLGFCSFVDCHILSLFVKHCPLIEEMNLEGCHKVDRESVSRIVSLTHLRVLNIAGCKLLDDNSIQLILQKCSHLEDLNMDGILGITDKSFSNLGENLNSTLLQLVLHGQTLTDFTFRRISLCTKLQHLTISYVKLELEPDVILVHLKKLTGLKSLELAELSIPRVLYSSDINNLFVGLHLRNLVKLKLSEMGIDDIGVHNISQNCKLLETLLIPHCYSVTEIGLMSIVGNCNNLRYLDLSWLPCLTGRSLLLVPEKLGSLEFLILTDCGIDKSLLFGLSTRVPTLKVFT